MKNLVKISILFIAFASLTSCTNISLLELFDFEKVDTEYALAHAREVTAQFPVTMKQHIGKDTIVSKRLPQGTKLKILAQKREFMKIDRVPQWYAPDIPYLVESNDGSRFFTLLPEACVGMSAFDKETKSSIQIAGISKLAGAHTGKSNRGSKFPYLYTVKGGDKKYIYEEIDWKMNRQVAVYNQAGIKSYTLDNLYKKLIGKSLTEIEQDLILADQLINSKGKSLAVFNQVNVKSDNKNSVLVLELSNGKATAINFDYAYESSKTTSFIYNMLVSSIANKSGASSLEIFPRFSFFNTYQIGPIARIVLAVILGIIFTFIFFLRLLPSLIALATFRIKPLSNGAVLGLSVLIYLIVAAGVIWYFGMIDFVSLIAMVFFIYVGIGSIKDDLEFNRCPHCHSVYTLQSLGKSDFSKSTSTSGVKSRDVFEKETRDYTSEGVIKTKHYRRERYKVKKETKYWKENYYCTACGKNISYSKTESSSTDIKA